MHEGCTCNVELAQLAVDTKKTELTWEGLGLPIILKCPLQNHSYYRVERLENLADLKILPENWHWVSLSLAQQSEALTYDSRVGNAGGVSRERWRFETNRF